jgi:hypothetical protein
MVVIRDVLVRSMLDELALSRASSSPDSGLMCDPKNHSGLDVAARVGFIQNWNQPSPGE